MTQDDLALLARVTRKTLATFESEGREPRDATLAKLQAALEGAGVVFLENDAGVGVMLGRAHGKAE